ncbi:MAG TPA: hypothetical protein VLV85_15310 [Stellaceae bacterium]|jgi:hypothetical protein|nr:hypothetical protein [Stellaceae bacterium]
MQVIPEKVFVQSNPEAAELVVVMDGFRLTLSRHEGEALRDGLTLGLKKLELASGEPRRPALIGSSEDATRMESRRVGSSSP